LEQTTKERRNGMDQIIDIIIKIVAMLLTLGASYVCKYLIAWLKTVLSEKDAEKLDLFVAELVAAAEQMYKQEDPDGSKRLLYVQTMLVEAGYDITEAVTALIESKVYSINVFGAVKIGGEAE
jgi:hypothetical protein